MELRGVVFGSVMRGVVSAHGAVLSKSKK